MHVTAQRAQLLDTRLHDGDYLVRNTGADAASVSIDPLLASGEGEQLPAGGAVTVHVPAGNRLFAICAAAEATDLTVGQAQGRGPTTKLHLGDPGFTALNGVVDDAYGHVPTILHRVGDLCVLYGALRTPDDFAGGSLEVCELPDASWDDDGFAIATSIYSDSSFPSDGTVDTSGEAYVKGASYGHAIPRIEMQGLAPGGNGYIVRMWWIART